MTTPHKQTDGWEERFDKRFTAVDWSEKRALIDIVGLDLLPHLKSFIAHELRTAREEERERIGLAMNNRKMQVIINNVDWNEKGRRDGHWELGYDDATYDFSQILSPTPDDRSDTTPKSDDLLTDK